MHYHRGNCLKPQNQNNCTMDTRHVRVTFICITLIIFNIHTRSSLQLLPIWLHLPTAWRFWISSSSHFFRPTIKKCQAVRRFTATKIMHRHMSCLTVMSKFKHPRTAAHVIPPLKPQKHLCYWIGTIQQWPLYSPWMNEPAADRAVGMNPGLCLSAWSMWSKTFKSKTTKTITTI